MAAALNNLALLYKITERYEEAEPLYHQALNIWKEALGPKHPLTVMVLKKYIDVLRLLNREDEAKALEGQL